MSAYTFIASAFVIATIIVWAPEWTKALQRLLREEAPPRGARADAAFRLPPKKRTVELSMEDELLTSPPWKRSKALEKLAKLPPKQAADMLIPLLPRVPEEDRQAWISLLLSLGDERVPQALYGWLDGAPAEHLPLASKTSSSLEDKPKVVELFHAYGARNRRIQSEVERLLRASHLGCSAQVDPALLKRAQNKGGKKAPSSTKCAPSPFDRARNLRTLHRKDAKTCLAAILHALRCDESPHVRAIAVSLLQGREEESVRLALLSSLEDGNAMVRQAANRALRQRAV